MRSVETSDRSGEGGDATICGGAICTGPSGDEARGLTQRLRNLVAPPGEAASGELADGPSGDQGEQADAGVQETGPASRILDQVVEVISTIKG